MARHRCHSAHEATGFLLKIVEGGGEVPLPGSELPPFNTIASRILQDGRGDWWIGTDRGLFRFHGPQLRFSERERFTWQDKEFPEGPFALAIV